MRASPTNRILLPLAAVVLACAVTSVLAMRDVIFGAGEPKHIQPLWTWRGAARASWTIATDSSGTLYTLSGQTLCAVSKDGRALWQQTLPEATDSLIAAGGGMVYATDWEGRLLAVDAKTGTGMWWRKVAEKSPGSRVAMPGRPAVAPNGNVYVGGNDLLQVYNAAGVPQLSMPEVGGGFINAPPQFDARSDVFLSSGKTIIACDTAGHSLSHAIAVGDGETFKVSPTDSHVYVYGEYKLRAFDLHGQPLWDKDMKVTALAIDDQGKVYCGTGDGVLCAFDAAGRKLWSARQWVLTLNAQGSGPLFAVVSERTVLALDRATGRPLWDCASPPSSRNWQSPIYSLTYSPAGFVSFSGEGGEVYAVAER